MGNEWALVFFTSFIALGAGTFMAVGVNEWRGYDPKIRWPGAIAAIVLLALGGFSSVMHLGHPERIFGALGHPTSGIFMESSTLGITALCIVAYLVALKRNASANTRKVIATLGVILAAILAFAVGDSYIMGARPAWDTLLLPFVYLLTAVVAGCFAYNMLRSAPTIKAGGLTTTQRVTLVSLAILAVLIVAYIANLAADQFPEYSRSVSRVLTGDLAILFWGGVVVVGLIAPTLLTFKSNAQTYAKTATVAMVCLFIGAISFRLIMFKLGTSVWQFF